MTNDRDLQDHAPILIHIGMIKTGSTWLQEFLFGNQQSAFWSSAPAELSGKLRAKHGSGPFYRNDQGNLVDDDEFDLPQVISSVALNRMPDGHCAILSNERLSGHPLSNGIDRRLILDRLKAAFPHAKILIVIREQRSMILSNYFQYLKFGGSRSIQDYLNGENDARVPSVSSRFWHYHRLVDMYQRSFGAENVLVLPFEMLAQDSAGFVRTICNFAGVDVLDEVPATTKLNARSEYFSYAALRFLSPLIRSSRGNAFALSLFGRKAGKKIHLGMRRIVGSVVPSRLNAMTKRSLMRKLELALDKSVEHSNRLVEMSTGLDLARYGYAVAMANPAQDGN